MLPARNARTRAGSGTTEICMTDQTLTAPFGFRIDAAGRLELCPERQDAVATAYGLLIDGAPPEAIGAAVRALGFSVSDEDCV